MSDTPRTDAAAIRCACSTYVVPSEFAQQLEKEVRETWDALFDLAKDTGELRATLEQCEEALELAFIGGSLSATVSEKVAAALASVRKEAQP
ncbi:MAG: hypothetical protein EBR82_10525 [Caulobacteraceae bacterium]|nr:hypothetical protein [Caulobacteraceae bacterium]